MANTLNHKQREEIRQQRARYIRQEQLVGYWSKTKGISKKSLERHPHIDDVILLLKWRESMWHMLNKSEQAIWGAYWGNTYKKQKALKNKALKKLEQITITATERQEKAKQQRKRIKALRQGETQNPNEKSSAYMTAKSEDAACSAPWE
jgi:hypothetical protein